MDKKLPKVFANKIDKNINNNERVYVAKGSSEAFIKEENETQLNRIDLRELNINQKIKAIFNSKSYIYKADVEIVQKGQKVIKKIIGKNGNHLITIDNEIIPIETIEDIQLVNKNNSKL